MFVVSTRKGMVARTIRFSTEVEVIVRFDVQYRVNAFNARQTYWAGRQAFVFVGVVWRVDEFVFV
jgi:hypothetical protein